MPRLDPMLVYDAAPRHMLVTGTAGDSDVLNAHFAIERNGSRTRLTSYLVRSDLLETAQAIRLFRRHALKGT